MSQTLTITQATAQILHYLEGVRARSLDDNREREAAIKAKMVKLPTSELTEIMSVAGALLDLTLGTLDRITRTNIVDVYRAAHREWLDTRF